MSNQPRDIEDLMDMEEPDSPSRNLTKKQTAIRKNFKKKEKQNRPFDKSNFDQTNLIPGTQKIYVKTFGCSHNISDSEFMMGQLVDYGYQLIDEPLDADLILINSCTVKNPSQEALMRMVFDSKDVKKPVVVAGCVPQGDRQVDGLGDVSIVGITQIDRVVEVVEETLKGNVVQLLKKKSLPSLDLPKIRKNNLIEIIPINTGCLGNCTYCKTKHARGHLGSYKPEEILERMNSAFSQGVLEIWLTSEDTGAYGRDINTSIVDLLVLLVKNMPPGKMLRVGMTNPPYILEHLEGIGHILNHPQVYKFLHVPVQAGHDNTLERMNREYTVEDFEKVCDYLVENVPDMTISTDIICGFPGETDEEFKGTHDLVQKYKFPVLNISQFYPRPGTVAERMKQCNTKDKKARSKDITALFGSYKNMDHMMGRTERVWITEWENHRKSGKIVIGHTSNYSKVVIPYEEELVGKEVIMKITKCLTWHIEGEIIDRNPEPIKAPENILDGIEEMYARKKAIQDELMARRKAERRERLKALRKKAQEEERKKQEAREAAESKTLINSQEITENDISQQTNNTNQVDNNNVQNSEKSESILMDYTMLYIGVALVLIGIILKMINL